MKKIFSVFCSFLFLSFSAAGAHELASHEAVYDISLASTKGGAVGVVDARGKMGYRIRKVCDQWETESVFSLDVGYEMAGPDTTNWKQTTKESADGCLFEFDVFVREKGADRKDLSGKAVCEGNKKVLRLELPVRSEAIFPKNVVFPVQQTLRLLHAAKAGKKSVSAYVYDGTRPDALYSMNAMISFPEKTDTPKISGDVSLVSDKKAYRYDTAFFEEFSGDGQPDGEPRYEVSMHYYENGISDQIEQDFGAYRLKSTLKKIKKLKDIPCPTKKKRQSLTTR